MKYFCDKYGKECPNTTPQAQSYNCDAWDPREFLADKTCRHALTVDDMEMAKQQWLAAQKIGPKKKRRIETPERPKPQPVIINKAGEIDAKLTAILQRLELMQRQTAAQEKHRRFTQKLMTAIRKQKERDKRKQAAEEARKDLEERTLCSWNTFCEFSSGIYSDWEDER